jgi:hypothetical protein
MGKVLNVQDEIDAGRARPAHPMESVHMTRIDKPKMRTEERAHPMFGELSSVIARFISRGQSPHAQPKWRAAPALAKREQRPRNIIAFRPRQSTYPTALHAVAAGEKNSPHGHKI